MIRLSVNGRLRMRWWSLSAWKKTQHVRMAERQLQEIRTYDSLDDYNNENNLERLLPNSDKFLQLYRDSAARAVGHNSMDPGSTPGGSEDDT
uniref:Uncharacterized protein n=1 Tax=Timema bartmani TaxID=61472 RepID=A0A7R9EZW3_9NEOP|nr:unnamed protein product [Timema bartmani]